MNSDAASEERAWLAALKLDPHLEERIIAEAQTGLLHLRDSTKLLFQIQSVKTLGGEHLLAIDLVHAERGLWADGPSRCPLCEPHSPQIREALCPQEEKMPAEFDEPLPHHLDGLLRERARIGPFKLADIERDGLREAAVEVVAADTERAIERVLLDDYLPWRQKAQGALAPYLPPEDWRTLFDAATRIDVTAQGGLSMARVEVFHAAEEILDARIP